MPIKRSKIRQSAKFQDCQIRIPGVCNFNNETTVLAHINGAGMGIKSNDIHASFSCSCCHDAIDGRIKTQYSKDDLKLMFYDGMVRTQLILINKGLIVIT